MGRRAHCRRITSEGLRTVIETVPRVTAGGMANCTRSPVLSPWESWPSQTQHVGKHGLAPEKRPDADDLLPCVSDGANPLVFDGEVAIRASGRGSFERAQSTISGVRHRRGHAGGDTWRSGWYFPAEKSTLVRHFFDLVAWPSWGGGAAHSEIRHLAVE